MAKYGKKSGEFVRKAMKKYKAGKLKSGRAKVAVMSREQAIAIGLSKARKKGVKVPKKAVRKK
ncbi:MAG: hypothetical protein A3E80_04860 [Chlamydiae bacterium RIFCSPHIGHO2_12_FULL_49_9]|nr:MAG: hypothetical protein A3E80_04860 [Chlamydiae bacterium RIFCSPHIGHO2_12_FULL_49_9]